MAPTKPSTLSRSELAAWRGMLETHSAVLAELDRELERDHGLPLTSYEVLMNLADSDGEQLRMSELADRLLVSRSGITRLIDRLERQGLVARQRCDNDGRGFYAILTPDGRAKVEAARPDHLRGVHRHFLSRLTGAEIEALGQIWSRLRAS